MNRSLIGASAAGLLAAAAQAQNNITWADFQQDNSLIPATSVVLNDSEERDYDYADLDKDGWTDLVIMRKQPFTTSGRRTNVLLMNESGTLVDRTTQYASASDVPGDNGFDTATNDRDVVIADINGDTWLDVITATTLGNGQTKAISHPRVYINLGESGGNWQGLEYQEARIPQLVLAGGGNAIPFFCGVDAGDIDGDGDLDLYFSDYDVAGNPDVNDRLLLNNGSGFFTDESFSARVTTAMLASPFGTSVNLEDMNGDGAIDIVKNTGVGQTSGSARVDISYNNPANEGFFNFLQTALQTTPYHVDTGDLNQDGMLDFAASDDGSDRYLINQGNDGLGRVNWSASQTFNTDDGFGSNVLIQDLNNDNWPEIIICDVDVDIAGFGRRLHIYHNRGGAVGGIPSMIEESGGGDTGVTGMSTGEMGATHDVAAFDIDNDGDIDMVIGRNSGTDVWINQLISGPPPPVHANDTCATPAAISGEGSFAWNQVDATSSGFTGGSGTCASAQGNLAPHLDIFFQWSATVDGDYTIDVCGSTLNTDMNIHSGVSCLATCLQNNDDFCLTSSGFVVNGLLAGDPYLIQIGNWATADGEGNGSLNIVKNVIPPPSNDTCFTPTNINGEGAFAYDTTNATTTGFNGGGVCSGGIGQDVFYQWTANADGDYTIDTCASGYDTFLGVHSGVGCGASCIASDDDTCGNRSQIVVTGVLSGDQILVQVGGFGANEGPGTLTITKNIIPPPSNNDCTGAIAISGEGTTNYDTSNATDSGFTGGTCTSSIGQDVFYVWTALTAGDYTIDTCGTGYDTLLNVHNGGHCLSSCIGSNDDSCGAQSSVTVTGIFVGQQLLIQVGGFGAAEGAGVLNITLAIPPPSNDTCATPDPIAGEASIAWDNTNATTSGFDGTNPLNCMSQFNSEFSGLGPCQNDLFWVFTAPCDGDWQVDTEGTSGAGDTRLNIHTGTNCSASCLQSDDNGGSGNLSSSIIVGVQEGDQYLLQTGTWATSTTTGTGMLNVSRVGGVCPVSTITIGCDPASPHIGGLSAKLNTSYFGSGVESDLHLECTDGPANQFGFFLVSGDGSQNLSVFNGVLCLGAPSGRYTGNVATNQGNPQLNSIGQFNGSGVLQNLASSSTIGSGYDVPLQLPFTPAGQSITLGTTWFFQCWFRDTVVSPGDSANFSNMVEATFN